MMRNSKGLLFVLGLPLLVPALIALESANDYIDYSESVVKVLLEVSKSLTSDVELLADVTPALLALLVAAASPRKISSITSVIVIVICLFGYSSYALFASQVEGSELVDFINLGGWVKVTLEGSIPINELDDCIQILVNMLDSVRLYYLIVGFSIIGIKIKNIGTGQEQNGTEAT